MSGLSFDLAWTAPDGGFRLACAAELPARGVTAVYGPSGAGKSTLLHCIAGLRRGDPGTHIAFAGEPWQADGSCLPALDEGPGGVPGDGPGGAAANGSG